MSKLKNLAVIYHGRNSDGAQDYTEDLKDHGFKSVRVDARFFDGTPEPGANRVILMEDVSVTKAEQILRIYPLNKIHNEIKGMEVDEKKDEEENELPSKEDALMALDGKLDWPELKAMASKVSDKPVVKKVQAMAALEEYIKGMED